MSHNLAWNEKAQQYSFASAIETPWHKLGQILPNKMTSKEAIENAHLDYEVFKQKLYTGDGKEIESHFVNIRQDNGSIMGVVGKDYTVIQNSECFEFFDNVVGADQAIFQTAGALGLGEIVFMSAKLETVMKVLKDTSVIDNYIVFMTSHNSTYPISAFFTPTRVVCQNTLNAALNNRTNKVSIRHTRNAKSRFDEAARVMGLNTDYMDTLKEALNHLASVPVSDSRAKELISRVLMSSDELKALVINSNVEFSIRKYNMIMEINHYYQSAKDLDSIRGTAYGLYNGITGYFQNKKGFTDDDKKMLSIIDGYSYNIQNKMFQLLGKE